MGVQAHSVRTRTRSMRKAATAKASSRVCPDSTAGNAIRQAGMRFNAGRANY